MGIREVLIFGSLGGICPSVSKLAASFAANPSQDLPVAGVYVSLALFALLGAIVALGFGAKEVRASIVAGIAAPAIVTNVLSGALPSPGAESGRQPSTVTAQLTFSWAAYAQDLTEMPIDWRGLRPSAIEIIPSIISGNVPANGAITYEWKDGNSVITGNFGSQIIDPTTPVLIPVPDNATEIEINGMSYSIESIENAGGALDIKIQTAPTFSGDLLWALGAGRSFQINSLEITPGETTRSE